MKGKKAIVITILITMLLSCILPVFQVSAATNEKITLNSKLYEAVKSNLETKGIYATYNDAQYTLSMSQEAIDSITELNLSNHGIKDLTGLDKFSHATSVDLSANELTKDSNLEVLNSFNLKFLDLSSNQISDVSSITNINDIETVNLHNQKFDEAIIINNSVVKEGTYKYECELPQIVREYAKPIKSAWLEDSYTQNNGSKLKFDWSAFNSNSDSLKIVIGDSSNGNVYNGLATLKIKVSDMNNKLYNSEINLYYVVIGENQRGIVIKDKNMYQAIKEQLSANQTVNSNLPNYNKNTKLYDYAYDDQMIFVISINDLVNKITSLKLDDKKISDASGIEKFIGLEKELDLSSNYIDTIDDIVALQNEKDIEEAALQARFKELAGQLKERVDQLEAKEKELETAKKEKEESDKNVKDIEKQITEANAKKSELVNGTASSKSLSDLKNELETAKNELNTYINTYNNTVRSWNTNIGTDIDSIENQLNNLLQQIKSNGSKYIEYSGEKIAVFKNSTTKYSAAELEALTLEKCNAGYSYADYIKEMNEISAPDKYLTGTISTLQKAVEDREGQIKTAEENIKKLEEKRNEILEKDNTVDEKLTTINTEIDNLHDIIQNKVLNTYDTYNNVYLVTSIITPELKNITDEEFDALTLETATSLLSAQVSKIKVVEKYLTPKEKDKAESMWDVDFSKDDQGNAKVSFDKYYTEKMKVLAENKNVNEYKAELKKLREFDAWIEASNSDMIYNYYVSKNGGTRTCAACISSMDLKVEDGESVNIFLSAKNTHCCYRTGSISQDSMVAIAGRIANATEADISSYVVLPRLWNLNMSENLIENADEISIMKELRRLYLGDNEIVDVTNVDWSAIPMLNTLDLSLNNISEIKVLEVLKNMKNLNLSKNLIGGSFDFTISDMKKLETLDLSQNQIDDIEYLKSQFEYIAKDNNMTVEEYLLNNISINLQSQSLTIETSVEKNDSMIRIALPKIFNQLEELQNDRVSFGTNSLYGNATSDGKAVLLNVSTLGTKTATVIVKSGDKGAGIGNGTTCNIVCKVVDEFDVTLPEVTFTPNGGTYTLTDGKVILSTVVDVTDNEEVVSSEYAWATSSVEKQSDYTAMDGFTNQTIEAEVTEAGEYYLWIRAKDNSGNIIEQCSEVFVVNETGKEPEEPKDPDNIIITINTSEGSSISGTKNVNDTNYILVPQNTAVSDILKDITLNTEAYNIVVKDSDVKETISESEVLKTNQTVVIDGLEDKAKCIIVVKGDITADGETSMSDILKLNKYRNNKTELTDAEILAGNVVDSDDEINMSDILKLNQYRTGKINSL